ncbi:TPA: transposase, partial [Pseudomonas aeruginosa]|nr:transposase [Pseudomonas aeruginosa]
IHALLLQLLYAIPSEQQLYEQLNYNLLYRWFVGLEMKQKIWSFPVFVGDITVLLNSAEAVRIIGRIIGEVISGDLMQMPEFSLNFALLHTWQARHGGARRLNI